MIVEALNAKRNMMLALSLPFWLLCYVFVTKSEKICHDFDSCTVSTITETSTDTGGIQCWGYYSCSQSTITSESTSEIYCYASYSCYNAVLIQQIYSGDQDIDCWGLFSYVL